MAIAARLDHWPLSNYGMFSRRREATASSLVLVGVTQQGQEIRLQDHDFWRPYKSHKLAHCLRQVQSRDARQAKAGRADSPDVPAAVQSLLTHYETRRVNRQHDGPPLTGLRLYDFTWRIDPSLSNLDRPDRQELVCEYPPRQ